MASEDQKVNSLSGTSSGTSPRKQSQGATPSRAAPKLNTLGPAKGSKNASLVTGPLHASTGRRFSISGR